MTHLALMQILGPETCKQMIRDADAELPWLDPDENVVAEDRAWPTEGALFDDIPQPFDPYGCANPVSQEDGE